MSNLNGVGEKRVFPKLVANRQLDTKEFGMLGMSLF